MMVEYKASLKNPDYYQNRELSWLDFNARVIEEAVDPTNPLVEQLTFLAIGSSNLDEFYKVRVAGLQDQLKMGVLVADTKKQWAPEKQLKEIAKKNRLNVARQYNLFQEKKEELKEHTVSFRTIDALSDSEKAEIKRIFIKEIEPAITPYGIDAYRPFPHLKDGVLHLFVRLEKSGEPFIAIIPVSARLKRIYSIVTEKQTSLLFIEDILYYFLSDLFKGYSITYSFTFRITRNADLEIQEVGAEDILSTIEDYLEKRKNGRAVRLEIDQRQADIPVDDDIAFLKKELHIKQRDIYVLDGPIDLTFLHEVTGQLKETGLKGYDSFTPERFDILKRHSIYAIAKKQDLFFHHPFESFDPIIDFVKEAVEDERTVSIKQTLYRVSQDSPLIEALKEAVKKGIQVTVLVELKARFDEANNVHWAKELEEVGAHILYGVKGLKTHSKATLVVKKETVGFSRYVHLGTGNYNEETAQQYTDMGLVTADEVITRDVSNFFNYLSGYNTKASYTHLHVSPFDIQDQFIESIEKEMALHKEFGNGHIIAKMNSLTDKKMILKLYEASQAGVRIELIVRGICCLIPGIKGVSETITVRSVIGRFLEHSRIYYFNHNGEENLYLSSADMMTRNMIKRVEIAFPILDKKLKAHILSIMKLYLYDNTKAWVLDSDGIYMKLSPRGHKPVSAQQELMNTFSSQASSSPASKVKENKWVQKLMDLLNTKKQY